MATDRFLSRDISWLFFNDRILSEAADPSVPVLERIKFLAIFSSNLDEFYRVRIPLMLARQQLEKLPQVELPALNASAETEFLVSRQIIRSQQEHYGRLLREQLVPELAKLATRWLYDEPIPDSIGRETEDHFFSDIAPFLQPVVVASAADFFPVSNKLYLLVNFDQSAARSPVVVNIPTDERPRFLALKKDNLDYIVFTDDIIRSKLPLLFPGAAISSCYSFKITRDADLNLEDELLETLAEDIERLLATRDGGLASRLLYEAGMPLRDLQFLAGVCRLPLAAAVEGGRYHNLKDLMGLPVAGRAGRYPPRPSLLPELTRLQQSLFDVISAGDIMLHPPYHSYQPAIRFFSEAAIDPSVKEIFVTLYRIASDSKIAQALITAARNGKQVQVFMELKARFDEANNLRWAKKMKSAGVKVIYSIPRLKVHAKMALVKKEKNGRNYYYSLLSTGNLNESTAKLYTDHVLMTADKAISRDVEMLFLFLSRRKRPDEKNTISFSSLLVAQFNLQQRFLGLIDREIDNARAGRASGIRIKVNNLEEPVMIAKLYEASRAGVKVQLMVRSICCLSPGVAGMSENITVHRLVGRFLEHGRIFWFSNAGRGDLYMGSADWMNRNIHTRIEVCFPVSDQDIARQIEQILDWQLNDTVQAVNLNEEGLNEPLSHGDGAVAINAQDRIYDWLAAGANGTVYKTN